MVIIVADTHHLRYRVKRHKQSDTTRSNHVCHHRLTATLACRLNALASLNCNIRSLPPGIKTLFRPYRGAFSFHTKHLLTRRANWFNTSESAPVFRQFVDRLLTVTVTYSVRRSPRRLDCPGRHPRTRKHDGLHRTNELSFYQ